MLRWLALAGVLAGCADAGVGRPCGAGTDGGVGNGILLRADAVECPSRLCLEERQGGGTARATCTVNCVSDDDCGDALLGPAGQGLCDGAFVCAVATVVGPFACQRLCVCDHDLVCGYNSDERGVPITPTSCPAPSPAPSCP